MLSHPQFQANPIAAISNHIVESLKKVSLSCQSRTLVTRARGAVQIALTNYSYALARI